MPSSRPAMVSLGWCMPRYIRASATSGGMASASVQQSARRARLRKREVITRVTPTNTATDAATWPEGKLAIIGRWSRCDTARAVALDHHGGDPVCGRLHRDRRQHEAGDPPVAPRRRREHGDGDHCRDRVDVRDLGHHIGGRVQQPRPVGGQNHVHVLVVVAQSVERQHHVQQQQAQQHCQPRQHQVAGEHHGHEHGDRVAPLGTCRTADRRCRRVVAPAPARPRPPPPALCGSPICCLFPWLQSSQHRRFPDRRGGQTFPDAVSDAACDLVPVRRGRPRAVRAAVAGRRRDRCRGS